MEVKINKEIRNYTESMFFGLSLRQFIFSLLACGVAVGLYFILRPYFGIETLSWVCILGAAPFAVMGFVKYNGKMCIRDRFNIVQGLISTIMNAAGFGSAAQTVLPQEIVTAVEDCGFFESIPLWLSLIHI